MMGRQYMSRLGICFMYDILSGIVVIPFNL